MSKEVPHFGRHLEAISPTIASYHWITHGTFDQWSARDVRSILAFSMASGTRDASSLFATDAMMSKEVPHLRKVPRSYLPATRIVSLDHAWDI